MKVADSIITACEEMGVSPAGFARKLGVHRSYVHRWIHDGDIPRMPTLKKIARLIDAEVVWTGREFQLEKRAA